MPLDLAGTHRFLVSISGIGGYWRTSEPPERSADTREEYDGGDPYPVVIADRPTMGDMTVARGYDPRRDGALLRGLLKGVGVVRRTIAVQDLDADETPIGRPLIYEGLLKGVQPPKTDRNGSDTAMLETTWHVHTVA